MELGYVDALQMVINTLQTVEVKATKENMNSMLSSIQILEQLKVALGAETIPQAAVIPDHPAEPVPEVEVEVIDNE